MGIKIKEIKTLKRCAFGKQVDTGLGLQPYEDTLLLFYIVFATVILEHAVDLFRETEVTWLRAIMVAALSSQSILNARDRCTA